MAALNASLSYQDCLDAFDGIMVSDGNLSLVGISAKFTIALSGKEHNDWLSYIVDVLTMFKTKLPSEPVQSRTRKSSRSGKEYDYCYVQSRLNRPGSFVHTQYSRWYSSIDHNKHVPKDIRLSQVMIANWVMGDGTSAYRVSALNSVQFKFCTNGLSVGEVVLLITELNDRYHLGAILSVRKRGKGEPEIYVQKMEGVNRLMEIVQPYILPSYEYKIKKACSVGDYI